MEMLQRRLKECSVRGLEPTLALGVHARPHPGGRVREQGAARGATPPCHIWGKPMSQRHIRSDSGPSHPKGRDPSAHSSSPLPRQPHPGESCQMVSK